MLFPLTFAPEQQAEMEAAHREISRILGYLAARRPPTARQRNEWYARVASGYSTTTLRGLIVLLTEHIADLCRNPPQTIEILAVEPMSDDDLGAEPDRRRHTFDQLWPWLSAYDEEIAFIQRCLADHLRQKECC